MPTGGLALLKELGGKPPGNDEGCVVFIGPNGGGGPVFLDPTDICECSLFICPGCEKLCDIICPLEEGGPFDGIELDGGFIIDTEGGGGRLPCGIPLKFCPIGGGVPPNPFTFEPGPLLAGLGPPKFVGGCPILVCGGPPGLDIGGAIAFGGIPGGLMLEGGGPPEGNPCPGCIPFIDIGGPGNC